MLDHVSRVPPELSSLEAIEVARGRVDDVNEVFELGIAGAGDLQQREPPRP